MADTTLPGVLLTDDHASRPAATAVGTGTLYSCTDHSLIYQSDGATWSTWADLGGTGAVATDAIWDAAGDLAVGSGANTAAKLAIGAAGGALSRVNGAVAWNSGTAFPTAATGDRYWRTDLGMEFYYDGTRWLSTSLYHLTNSFHNISSTGVYASPTGTLNSLRMPVPALAGGSDLWLEDLNTHFIINAGTALSGSHKWVGTFYKRPTGNTNTTLITITIDSGSINVWRTDAQAVNALINNGTIHYSVGCLWTITGTPGSIEAHFDLTYRIVAT